MAINYYSAMVSESGCTYQSHSVITRSSQRMSNNTKKKTTRPASKASPTKNKQTRPWRVGQQEQSSHGFNTNSNSFSTTHSSIERQTTICGSTKPGRNNIFKRRRGELEEEEEEMNPVKRSKSTDRLSYGSNQQQDTRTGNPNQVNENENENDQR